MSELPLSDEITGGLSRRAQETGESVTSLAERLIEEGLKRELHPGISFQLEGDEQVAYLKGIPIWEIIAVSDITEDLPEDDYTLCAYFALRHDDLLLARNYTKNNFEEIENLVESDGGEAATRYTDWLDRQ